MMGKVKGSSLTTEHDGGRKGLRSFFFEIQICLPKCESIYRENPI
jgi:hypothetical protein